MIWTAIPILLVIWIATVSYQTYDRMSILGPMEPMAMGMAMGGAMVVAMVMAMAVVGVAAVAVVAGVAVVAVLAVKEESQPRRS